MGDIKISNGGEFYEEDSPYDAVFSTGGKWLDIIKAHSDFSNKLYHQCLEDLTPILGRARAKESARFFKTMNSQITLDISFNFRSFMHFQGLRNKPNAQKEVRELAQQMLELVQNIEGNPFEHTLKAFENQPSN